MTVGFSQHVSDQIGYYVYLLVDPRTPERRPFYVGKGKGNRAFDHLREAITEDDEPPPKYDVIDAIRRSEHEPGVVLAAHRLSEDEAFRLEAVLIQSLRLRELTNRVEGHKFDETMLDAEDISLRYQAQTIEDEEIGERVLYVSLNGGREEAYPGIRRDLAELRRRTLGDWRIAKAKAARTELVAGVYAQVVRTLFRVAAPGEKTSFSVIPGDSERVRFSNGELVEHRLIGKRVATKAGDTLTKFYQGSIRYGVEAWSK